MSDAERARRLAHEILSERRFHETRPPKPFRAVLDPLADWLRDLWRSIEDDVDAVAGVVPGGQRVGYAAGALVVLLAAAYLASRVIRRRAREALSDAEGGERRHDDPARLEREADEAERHGDLERALRLRFRAGLLRLDRAGAIDYRDSLTSGAVARGLRSPEFDAIARTFDEVVYGRRAARREDVARARDAWSRVLTAARQ